MSKWKFLVRIAALLLASLCAVSGAFAESGCYDTSDNGGKPRTDIEPGRSDTFGFDPIPYESQRETVSRWPETGSQSPSYSSGSMGGNSASSGGSACQTDSTGASSPSSTVCPPTGSGSAAKANGSETCPPTGSGSAPKPNDSETCPPTGSGSASKPNGNTTYPPATEDCDETPSEPETPTNGSGDDGHYTPGSLTSQESYLLNAINEERASRGLSALPVDMELTEIARAKSADMIENNYFAHESPTYGRASDMLDDAGYSYTSVSENIARSGSVEKAHVALMSSSGHRSAILGTQWKKIGIGVISDANGYPYVTQLFVR